MANDKNAEDAANAAQQQPQQQQQQNSCDATTTDSSKRATTTATTLARGSINDLVADLWINGNNREAGGDYSSPPRISQQHSSSATATTLSSGGGGGTSSSFSFKHFLNSSGTVTAPSTTVTSLDAIATTATTSSSTNSLQTSTGARPKVPQSASASLMQPDLNGSGSSSAASKMKRSPRFSSFDSQASLAEYAACGSTSGMNGGRLRHDLRLDHSSDCNAASMHHGDDHDEDDDDDHAGLAQVRNSRLYDDRVDDDVFPSAASNHQQSSSSPASRYVPRSYSSYEMPPTASTSPRRRPAVNAAFRPNRLVLPGSAKMKLDLPLDTSASSNLGGVGLPAALPDFVQDHLPDAWCEHRSSPPNSPSFGGDEEETPAGAVGGGLPGLPCAASLPPANSNLDSASASVVKMLPDFLSDSPIIHSSQRLADVAIGLPSNSIDSPPQESTLLQVANLRQENERLQREVQEIRMELSAQMRRSQDLEQELHVMTDAARRRESLAATASSQATQRLRRQVAQLEAEVAALRRSRDSSIDGAVGGDSLVTPSSCVSGSGGGGGGGDSPSRSHQLSRDLLRAADNAEQNLRQLLVGVANLRQMAANIEPQASPSPSLQAPSSSASQPPSNPGQSTDFN